MSVNAKQQISIHLKTIRNLGNFNPQRYMLRFTLYHYDKIRGYVNAKPVTMLNNNINDCNNNNNSSQLTDNSYLTKSFIIKSNSDIELNEICIFKNNINIYNYDNYDKQIKIEFTVEVIKLMNNNNRIIDIFNGQIKGAVISAPLIIDFYGKFSSEIIGTIHSCVYMYEFIEIKQINNNINNKNINNNNINNKIKIKQQEQENNNQKYKIIILSFENYIQNKSKQYIQDLLKYLKQQIKQNLNKIQQMLNEIKYIKQKQQKNNLQKQKKNQKQRNNKQLLQINKKLQLNDISQNQTQIGQEIRKNQIKIKNKQENNKQCLIINNKYNIIKQGQIKQKWKKKIFSKQSYQKNYQIISYDIEKILNNYGQQIYQKWIKLQQILLINSQQLIQKLYKQYHQKLYYKISQSIIKFKGSWDIDIYSNQGQHRNKMAKQLRTIQLQQTNNVSINSEFLCYNANLFGKNQPIYFMETITAKQNKDKKNIKDKNNKHNKDNNKCNKYNNKKDQKKPKQITIILVHGLGACRLDLQKLKAELKRYYNKKVKIFISSSNQSRTQGNIIEMGNRLASQITNIINKNLDKDNIKIALIGHSMGGLIIRVALPLLSKYQKYFYSLITLGTPHIGYNYSTSTIVDIGLWLLNTMKKCQSLQQITMEDNKMDLYDTFLYKLSLNQGLQWFSNVTFISSKQDSYVPFYSARVQKNQQSIIDQKQNIPKGKIYCQMIDNILNRIQGTLNRIDIDLCIPQQNIDNLIGRAAHINLINNTEMLRMLCIVGEQIIF